MPEVERESIHVGVSWQYRSHCNKPLHAVMPVGVGVKVWVKLCNGKRAAERRLAWADQVECAECRRLLGCPR